MKYNKIDYLMKCGFRSALPVASMAVVMCSCPVPGFSDEVTIEKVAASCKIHEVQRVCSFSVTLRHNDEGWHHYADKWQVMSGERILATRVLNHPHVDEQPFTRSLKGVRIPVEVSEVRVRAWDSKHGRSPNEYLYKLP